MGYSQVLSPELFEQAVERMHKWKAPSQRNQQIAAAVRLHGQKQVEVAKEFGISQRRVSQICQQVERWHGCVNPSERGEVDGDERRWSDRTLSREQLTEVYRRSMRAFARSERPLATRRRGKRADGGKWSERCARDQKLDTGSLRVALRAVEMQWKLADRPNPRQREVEENREHLTWALSVMIHLRHQAEKRGDVPRGPGGPQAAVEQLVRTMLGSSPAEPPRDEVQASKAPTSGRGVGPVDVGGGNTLTNGQGFHGQGFDGQGFDSPPVAEAAYVSSNNRSGVEERVAAPAAASVVAASAEAAASCGEPAAVEVPAAGSQNFVNRRAPRDGVGSLWPQQTLDDGNGSPAKDSRPLEVAERTARTLQESQESLADDVDRPRQTPLPPATEGPEPTRIERLLASGRRLSPAQRRRLEGKANRRREHC